MTENDKKIRSQIFNVMAQKGLRQAPLARMLRITPQSLSQVLSGQRAVLPTSLTAVLDELGLELAVQKKDDGEEIVGDLDEGALLASGTIDLQAALNKGEAKLPSGQVDAWLSTFQTALTARPSPDDHARGTVVLVRFDHPAGRRREGQIRPAVIVTESRSGRRVRNSRAPSMYGVVPLAARSQAAVGELAPRLSARVGDLPADCMALCAFVRTVAPERIVGHVTELNDDEMWKIEKGLKVLYEIPWTMPDGWIRDQVRGLLHSRKEDLELRREIGRLYDIEYDLEI